MRVYAMDMLVSGRPGPPLGTFVECIWHHASQDSAAHGRERVLPNGRFQLVFNLGSGTAAVSGLRSSFVVVDTAAVSCAMGVVFAAAAPRRFFADSAREFCERSVPLSLVWGRRATRLVDRLQEEPSPLRRLSILESALVEILITCDVRHLTLHPAVMQALRAFHRAPHIETVTDVSLASGWSRRWLTRVFSDCVDMTPKRYCRLLRFQHVVRRVYSGGRVNWADLVASGGFSDQAHLAHEFRAFSGLSPASFLQAERPSANHVRID
jgi:AraC-like DNA-binding protein